jgi:hypothetical protein
VPGRQTLQQEHAFEQRHVVPYRRAAELERRGQIAYVEQPGSLGRCERQQPRQRLQRADAGQISHVALDQGIQIVVIPLRAPPARWTRQRRRIAARDNPFRQQLSQPRTPFERESAAAQGVEEVGHAPFTLDCASGCSRRVSRRPARESESAGTSRT